jgi:hypothetical protein
MGKIKYNSIMTAGKKMRQKETAENMQMVAGDWE